MYLPVMTEMCGICQLSAIGLSQLENTGLVIGMVHYATLAGNLGHERFHKLMDNLMEERKLGINLELLSQLTFFRKTPEGLECSKIALIRHPTEENSGKQ
jgi:hypothetical protein